jgi:drug/metabolite transporter (DMT)-like permease
MQPAALGFLLVAAVFHAAVNLLLKQARDKLAFTWWLLGTSCLLWSPLLFYGVPRDALGWELVTASGLLEAGYFVTLSRAYSVGDLSQVYPIARGSAPLFIVAWAGIFLEEKRSLYGLLGVATIVARIYLINLPSLRDWRRPVAGFQEPAARWALLTGLLISAYQMVDKLAVTHVDARPYLVLILSVAWLALTLQWLQPARRRALLDEVTPSKGRGARAIWLPLIVGALLGNASYLLVLWVLTTTPVTYVAPVREVSVVIGAWIAVRFLGERGGAVRILASALIVLGIALISLLGKPSEQPADVATQALSVFGPWRLRDHADDRLGIARAHVHPAIGPVQSQTVLAIGRHAGPMVRHRGIDCGQPIRRHAVFFFDDVIGGQFGHECT